MFCVACVMTALTLAAQQATGHFDVRVLKDPSGRVPDLRMPIFSSTAQPDVAQRVNHMLQIAHLEGLAPKDGKAPFKRIHTPGEMRGVTNMSFRVLTNSPRVLSVLVEGEACGAYCEPFSTPHVFDSQTGKVVHVEALFTPQGLKALTDGIHQERRHQVEKARIQARKDWKKDNPTEPFPEGEDVYLDCLSLTSALNRFYLKGDSLHFTEARCSNHASQSMDPIGVFDNARPVSSLKSHLSPYGKALLLGEGTAPNGSGDFTRQLLRGTVGTKPVLFVLERYQDEHLLGGTYVYEHVGAGILLNGRQDGNAVILTEAAEGGKKHTLRLSVEGTHLTGTWNHANGKTQLPVDLTL